MWQLFIIVTSKLAFHLSRQLSRTPVSVACALVVMTHDVGQCQKSSKGNLLSCAMHCIGMRTWQDSMQNNLTEFCSFCHINCASCYKICNSKGPQIMVWINPMHQKTSAAELSSQKNREISPMNSKKTCVGNVIGLTVFPDSRDFWLESKSVSV